VNRSLLRTSFAAVGQFNHAALRRVRFRFALAVLLGTVVGIGSARQYARATTCAIPAWRLRLQHSPELDASIWPQTAALTGAYGPPLLLDSISFISVPTTDWKIDHLQGGEW